VQLVDPAGHGRQCLRPVLEDRQAPASVGREQSARPAPLPEKGEVTRLNAAALRKLAALVELLRAAERDSLYEIKVIDVPQARSDCMGELSCSSRKQRSRWSDELQALVAHEIGYEYVWTPSLQRRSDLGSSFSRRSTR
jgi:hypothetical protein